MTAEGRNERQKKELTGEAEHFELHASGSGTENGKGGSAGSLSVHNWNNDVPQNFPCSMEVPRNAWKLERK